MPVWEVKAFEIQKIDFSFSKISGKPAGKY
jgi:hypothetical protein